MREALEQLALLRFARLIVGQLGSISSLSLIPTIHSFSSLRVQRNTHGVLANPDLRQAMAPSKQKRTHTVFRASSAHRLASTRKPRFVGEKVKLGELISKAKVERCGDRSFPVYSMTMHDGIVEQSGRFKKTIASRDTSSYKVVKKNQLVVGFPIDEGVIYVQNHDQPGIMSPAYNVWDFDSDRVLPAYLEFVLHSPQSMAYYAEKMRGTTARRRTLTGDALKNMPVPAPSIEDQYAVVKTLNCIKSQLAATQQMLDKLDQLVKSRFVEMFGDPVTAASTIKLGEVANMKAGKTTTAKTIHDVYAPGLYPCYGGNGLRGYSAEPTHAGVFPLIGRQGALCGNVQIAHGVFRATEHAVVVDCKASCEPVWLFHYLKYDDLGRLATGAAQPGLSVKDLKLVPVQLPPEDRQADFISFASQVDKSGFATHCDHLRASY